MTDKSPIQVSEREWDRGLWAMVAASGVLHLIGIALLVLIPHTFLHHAPPLHSYTVDLVAPDKLGGTNSIAGGKGRVEAPAMAAVPKPEVKPPPQPPPPAKVEMPLPPKPEVKPPEPPKEVAKAEPPKPPEPPKPQPKEDEVALAAKVQPAPPTTAPVPTAASKPAPSPQSKPAPTPHAKPAPTLKAVAKAAPTAPSKAELARQKEAEAKTKEAQAGKERDDRIAAAIRRVEQQAGERGGGSGAKTAERAGGPISSGPGEGAGGTVMGIEFVIYKNQLEQRIKEKWAWVGSDQNLEATVHLSITPEGEVIDVHITKSSGDPSYDRSVERAVKAINPLPPPPEAYRKQFGDVEYTFTPKSLQM